MRDRFGDLVSDGLDAAVRFGEAEPSSLIARKLLDARVVTCAAPSYLARRGRPKHPNELGEHECIQFRDPRSGRPFEWIFQRGKKTISVAVSGRLVGDDPAAMTAACLAGHGIAQKLEVELKSLGNHGLVDLFPNWPDEKFPLYVYYPSRLRPPAKVRAFVDFVVESAR